MEKHIKLAIVGSRTFSDYEKMCQEVNKNFNIEEIECIVSGGAHGADSLGARFAIESQIQLVEFKPDWRKFGRSAGFIRNRDIINTCTHCIAFWDGQSHGTEDDINLCKKYGKPCIIVNF